MKNEYLLLTIIPIILIAGCVSPSPTEKPSEPTNMYSTKIGGLNLIISADNTTVTKDIPFLVSGVVTNKGDQEASNIKVKLVRESGGLTSKDFDVDKSVIPDPLHPGDETIPIMWSIMPVSTGSASVRGIMSYHYRTVFEVDLNVFGYSYIASSSKAYDEFKSSPSIKRVKGSTSPVVISISPPQKPLLVRGNEYPQVIFYISNPGNGAVRNLVLHTKSIPEGKVSCDTSIDEKAINFGKKYPIVCNVKYGESELESGSKVITIGLVLEYDYENVKFSPINLNIVSPY